MRLARRILVAAILGPVWYLLYMGLVVPTTFWRMTADQLVFNLVTLMVFLSLTFVALMTWAALRLRLR